MENAIEVQNLDAGSVLFPSDGEMRTENLTLEVKREPCEETEWCRDGHHETICQHAIQRGDNEPSESLEMQNGDATA